MWNRFRRSRPQIYHEAPMTIKWETGGIFRLRNDMDAEKTAPEAEFLRKSFSLERTTSSVRKRWAKGSNSIKRFGRNLRSRVFAEDHVASDNKILDPQSQFVQVWNKFFVLSCLVAIFLDPLFFYLPVVDINNLCIKIQRSLAIVITVLRTLTDTSYLIHMGLQFRTAFIAPASRVFGRGELVIDPKQIALRYLKRDFWLDVVAVLPLPQVIIWVIIPRMRGATSADNTKEALRLIVFLQYLPRLFRLYPLTTKMVKTTGVVMETAWAGAVYNLLLYLLASHVVGACWYLLAIERQNTCWRNNCDESAGCQMRFFDCGSLNGGMNVARNNWLSNTPASVNNCLAGSASAGNPNAFDYGLYVNAISYNITAGTQFVDKYLYCLWFGLLNLSSLGQTLQVSTYAWEILFAIAIVIAGLLLFALLIGNMQTYLQSLTMRLEEMRVKRRDTEQWMKHRQLPIDLRERVRRYDQFKWMATRGVEEGNLLESLPLDLRRDIKRHLCLDLVRRVPLFDQMDDLLLDAICEKLMPALNTQGTYIVREGDPVNEVLFIIRGRLQSETTNGGRTGFFNYGTLGPGDFCGEELLTWALDPKPSKTFPSSTRTVKALCEVEAFALLADDLKKVASQFRRLHSKQLQHTFRYYSQQWRTWAAGFIQTSWRRYLTRKIAEQYWKTWGACFIQGAWRRFIRRKRAERLQRSREDASQQDSLPRSGQLSTSPTVKPGLAPAVTNRFGANAGGASRLERLRSFQAAEMSPHIANIPKPSEPDFSVADD